MSYSQPRVSIGMPVYNGDFFLKEALNSLLAQTFEDFELIISDNASTDSTEEICREYAAQDNHIRYYRNEQNLGATRNFNRVVDLSNGEYFMWANHDDLYAPEFLKQCVEALDSKPSAILSYSRSILIDEEGRHVERLLENLNLNSPKSHQRFKRYHELHKARNLGKRSEGAWMPIYGVIRANVLQTTALIGNYIASDLILLEEFALLGKFHEVPELLFFKRDHPYRSMKAHRGYAQRILWFDPMKRRKFVFPQWKLFFERLFLISRVQISSYEKICCYVEMARYVITQRTKTLTKELVINLALLMNIKSVNFWKFQKELPEVW